MHKKNRSNACMHVRVCVTNLLELTNSITWLQVWMNTKCVATAMMIHWKRDGVTGLGVRVNGREFPFQVNEWQWCKKVFAPIREKEAVAFGFWTENVKNRKKYLRKKSWEFYDCLIFFTFLVLSIIWLILFSFSVRIGFRCFTTKFDE